METKNQRKAQKQLSQSAAYIDLLLTILRTKHELHLCQRVRIPAKALCISSSRTEHLAVSYEQSSTLNVVDAEMVSQTLLRHSEGIANCEKCVFSFTI